MSKTSSSRYNFKALAIVTMAALVLGVVGVSRADSTLVSPPLPLRILLDPEQMLCCMVTNLDSVDRTGNIQIIGQTGAVMNTQAITLPAGSTEDMCVGGFVTGYCKFTISGKKKFLRASVCVFDSEKGCIAALEASPAPRGKIILLPRPGPELQ